ncbi:MFS transporter [Bacillus subtilis]|nr:MFS transporter [Bacillus subtilis]MDM5301916.1 MFS transporter [Bacillus subtilis]MDM5323969.1 MFS transporter [Bacillus subtilis]
MNFKVEIFKNRNLIIILTSQLVFQLALWIGLIGNLQFLQNNVHSHFLQSLLLVAGSVFSLLIGPYAGNLIDGISKKKILLIVGILRMCSVIFMFVAIFTNSVWLMLLYSIGVSSSAAFFEPALQATISEVTEEKHLVFANSLNLNIVTLARIFGATLGGIILSITSLFSLYLIAFISFLFVLIITLFLKIEGDHLIVKRKRKKVVFREVFPVISGKFDVKMILFLSLTPIVFIAGFNLFIVEISTIQNNPSVKGLLYAIEGISLILSSTLVNKLTRNRNQIKFLLLSSFLIGAVYFILSFSNFRLAPFIAFCLFGLAYGLFSPLANTFNQKVVPNQFHGRFFAFKAMLERTAIQISMVSIGFLLDVLGFNKVVIVLGFISTVLVLILTAYYFGNLKMKNNKKNSSTTNSQI